MHLPRDRAWFEIESGRFQMPDLGLSGSVGGDLLRIDSIKLVAPGVETICEGTSSAPRGVAAFLDRPRLSRVRTSVVGLHLPVGCVLEPWSPARASKCRWASAEKRSLCSARPIRERKNHPASAPCPYYRVTDMHYTRIENGHEYGRFQASPVVHPGDSVV